MLSFYNTFVFVLLSGMEEPAAAQNYNYYNTGIDGTISQAELVDLLTNSQ